MTVNQVIRALAVTALLSCGQTLATRSYSNPATAKNNAYRDMKEMLEEICSDVSISNVGFACTQYTFEGPVSSNYQWEEIREVACSGRSVIISGKYDYSIIHTHGPIWKDTLGIVKQ